MALDSSSIDSGHLLHSMPSSPTLPLSSGLSKTAAALFTAHRIRRDDRSRERLLALRMRDHGTDLPLSPDPSDVRAEFDGKAGTVEGVRDPNDAFRIVEGGKSPAPTPVARNMRQVQRPSFSNFSARASDELNEMILEFSRDTWYYQLVQFVEKFSRRALFLVTLGFTMGLVVVSIDYCIAQLIAAGVTIATRSDFNWATGFFAYIFYCCFLVGISAVITQFLSPLSAGSGIPEMKSILSGARLPEYLSFKALVAKIVGLIFSVGGSLTIGQEGPFVHISSAISHLMLQIPWFRQLGSTDHSRSLILGIGCGVGIAAGFGAPFGGMLYAIEVTSTYYSMDNYFASFLACVVGAFTYRWLWNLSSSLDYWVSALKTNFYFVDVSISFGDLCLFALLGIFLAGASVLLVKIFTLTTAWRKHQTHLSANRSLLDNLQRLIASPIVFTALVILFTAMLNYPRLIGDFMSMSTHDVLDSVFSTEDLSFVDKSQLAHWDQGAGIIANLFFMGIIRLLFCAISMAVPVPCGMFFPCMVIGATLGRCWGEIVSHIFHSSIQPGVFAVAGATAMVSGVTHSLSTVLIIFEVTGQLTFAAPVTICTLVALMMSKRFSHSIYEAIIEQRKLPYLPTMKDYSLGGCISNIMEPCSFRCVVPLYCSVSGMIRVLTKMPDVIFPVTLSRDNLFLVGTISRAQLEKYVIEALHSGIKDIDTCSISSSEILQEKRNLFSKLSKTILDPMHRHVIVRPDFDLENVLIPLERFGRSILVEYEPSSVRLLPETSLVHAHILFILFRLQNAFVTHKGQLCAIVRRVNFVKSIQDPDSFR